MLTDAERQAIIEAVQQAESEPEVVRVSLVDLPQAIDPTAAIQSVAKAVEGVSGEEIAQAIRSAAQESTAATAKTLKLVGLMIVEAVAKLKEEEKPEAPEPPEKIDFTPITEAMDRNTKALERLIKAMSAPKMLIFDENDPTKPVGVAIHKTN